MKILSYQTTFCDRTSNITNVGVTCSTNSYTLGGAVNGLSGTVVLQNNGGDNLTRNSNGGFTFATPVASGAPYNVTILSQPAGQTCTVSNGSGTMGGSNVSNVSVTCSTNTTLSTSVSQLALSITGITEYGVTGTPNSGVARQITITNTGGTSATNLSITYPTWPAGTTASSTCGATLAAGATCTITVTPGANATSGCNTSHNAPTPGVITVNATNVAAAVTTNVMVLGYSCQYQGGYVYAFDDTTPNTGSVGGKVATISSQAGVIWSSNGTGGASDNVSSDIIPLISEIGSSPTYADAQSTFNSTYANDATFPFPASSAFSSCSGATNGQCNSNNILALYDTYKTGYGVGSSPYTLAAGPTTRTYYAAGLCKQTIAGYSDWYLPAICEMGYEKNSLTGTGCGNSGAPTLQNIQKSLIDTSGLSGLSGIYWSSTEQSFNPGVVAWFEVFASSGSGQGTSNKNNPLKVRCSRALTL